MGRHKSTVISDKNLQIIALRKNEHLTYKEIGKKFDLSRQRIAQILEKHAPELLGDHNSPIFCSHCRKELVNQDHKLVKARKYHCKTCWPLLIVRKRLQNSLLHYKEILEAIEKYKEKGLTKADIGRKLFPDYPYPAQRIWTALKETDSKFLKLKIVNAKLLILEGKYV